MAKVAKVNIGDPEVTVIFTKSELERWKSYAKTYSEDHGCDWFLYNMIDGILVDAKATVVS